MKITDLKIEKFHVELTEPFKIAFAEISHTESLLIKITTDEGIEGYGEAAPFAPVTGETMEGCLAVLQMFRQGLIGMNPMDIEKAHVMMDGLVHGNGSAKCAVDIALHDIKGKVMGEPLYRVLGGYQDTVQNDITIGISTPEKMAASAAHYVKDMGYRILKIKAEYVLLGLVGAIADGPTSALVASGARWKSLVNVGLLMGILGGVCGNYCGIAVAYIVRMIIGA